MKDKNGTYAGAGVDIDAGNAMVEKIKPLVRATRRRRARLNAALRYATHGDEIDPDRAMNAGQGRDFDLGADPIVRESDR